MYMYQYLCSRLCLWVFLSIKQPTKTPFLRKTIFHYSPSFFIPLNVRPPPPPFSILFLFLLPTVHPLESLSTLFFTNSIAVHTRFNLK